METQFEFKYWVAEPQANVVDEILAKKFDSPMGEFPLVYVLGAALIPAFLILCLICICLRTRNND